MITIDRLKLRAFLISFGVTVAALAVVGVAAAQVCATNAYVVTSSATPPTANWTNTSGVWNPSGGFPGCASGDSAADTNASPTTLIINGSIANPIVGLNLNCNGCVIDVQSGGSLALAGTGDIGSGATVKVTGGTLTIASGGTLTFHAGSNFQFDSGTVDIQTGGTIDFPTGANGVTTGGVMGGNGTLSISGGTLNIGSVTSPGTFSMTAGTLDGPGFLSITNSFFWDGGTIKGSGGAELAGNGSGVLSGNNGAMLLDGRTFNNYGFIAYPAAVNMLHLANNAAFNTYGTFQFQADGGIIADGPSSVGIFPNGLMEKHAGTGVSVIQPAASNNSVVWVTSGTIEFAGDGSHSGIFNPDTDGTNVGTIAFSAPNGGIFGEVFGNGNVSFPAGYTDFDGDEFSIRGRLSITGGTFELDNFVSARDFTFTAGEMDMYSDFEMFGSATWSGGTIAQDGGTFFVDPEATLTIDSANGVTQLDAAVIENGGTILYTAGSAFVVSGGVRRPRARSVTSGYLELKDGSTIFNDSGAMFDIQTDTQIASTITVVGTSLTKSRPARSRAVTTSRHGRVLTHRARTTGVHSLCGCSGTNDFENSGTLQKSQGSASTPFYPDLDNDGAVKALMATLGFMGAYNQTGGSTTLGPGDISVANDMNLNGGILDGGGTITGDVYNSGEIKPGTPAATGIINITGNYTMGTITTPGTLTIKLAGPPPNPGAFDQLNVTGTATLDGTFNASLVSPYVPANGTTWPVLTYASASGTFATQNLPTFAGTHGSITAAQNPTSFDLTAVVTPFAADLSVGVTGPATVNAGASLAYAVTVTNNGPDPTSGTTTIANPLPAGVTAASGSGSGWSCGAPSGGIITCTSTDTIANGGQFPLLTFSMTAPPDTASVSDSATVSSSSDPTASNNTGSAATTVVAQSDMSITKSGPTGVTAGQNVSYTVIVTNNGPSQATGVQVSDPQPANLTFVSNSGGCTTAYPCNLGTLNSGQSITITSTYSTSALFSGNVSNTATVSATNADPNNTNNSASATTNVGAQADLSITKSGPASINPGQMITYTIAVTNGGPSPATGTVVSDPTPNGMAFLSNTGACTTPYPCAVGTLTSGQTVTITSTYSVPASYSGGAIVNTATASSSVNDPNNANDNSTVTTTVGAAADVSIAKGGPASIAPGQNITYTINVSNFGPAGASGVVVSDPTPPGLTPVSVSSSSGCTSFPCNIGALAVGPPVTITATYNVPLNYPGASITNTATVSSASDPNAANNSSSATTSIASQADLGITKTGPPSFVPGQAISYSITITNSGTLAAANTFVNDATPAGLTLVAVSGGGCSSFPCSLGTVASGGSASITVTYNVPPNYAGASITNTAGVSTSSPESNTANNTATAVTPVSLTGSADLSLSIGAPPQVVSGTFVDITVDVLNNGPSAATNVVISNAAPSGLTFLSNSGACSTPYPCTISSLTSGQLITITGHYLVNVPSGSITSTASVTSSVNDPLPANNTGSTTMNVTPANTCPPAPTLLAPTAGTIVASPVTFSWTPVSGSSGYVVSITSGGSTQTIATTLATTTQTLVNGAYSWSVQSLASGNCPAVTSQSASFTVCNTPGAPLASVVGVTTTGQTYAVQWSFIDGTTSYELQESTDASFTNPASTTVAGTSQSFTKNVQSATPFFYRVRAVAGCNQTPGPFSATATIVIVPLPPLGSININVPVPAGSQQPVTFPLHVNGLTGVTTSFFATVDKPWLAVTPTNGIMPPEGINFTISADPSTLQDGTWTGTVIIVFGSSGVSGKTALDTAPKTSIPVSISLTSPVTPGTLTGPSATAVIIPSVGHLAGFGSEWQSDIRIANITSFAKKVQLTFNPGSATSQSVRQTTVSIDPGATTAFDDILRNWYGVGTMGDSSNGVLTVQPLDAAGKPDVSVSRATVASSRTYNVSSLGTLGQFIPAVPLANFISKAPGATSILALQQIAQSDTFRTNLGLVEAIGKPASVLVNVFNAGGSNILSLPVSLAAGEQRQLNSFLADKGITLTNGHIEVQATSGDGKVTAYASVIDSRSSDPLLVSGVPIGGTGASRFVIPGVASLDTGATWRSDVRVFNSSTTPQTATLTLYPTGNPSASVSHDVTIQPGEVNALDDIVHSTFNLTNAGGALHVTTAVAVPLIVTARTYDDTPGGTLGQFVQAVTPADAVGNGERSLQLLQMEDSPRYRTNLGLAEVTGKPATAEVTVILPDSKVAPKVQIPLAAFEYRQFAIISSLGLGNTYNARISVRVIDGQGKVTAYGSVIDQKTQDPTFVPAQ
jgi:uncharacterized repeat protein (TIGR01451 family)